MGFGFGFGFGVGVGFGLVGFGFVLVLVGLVSNYLPIKKIGFPPIYVFSSKWILKKKSWCGLEKKNAPKGEQQGVKNVGAEKRRQKKKYAKKKGCQGGV